MRALIVAVSLLWLPLAMGTEIAPNEAGEVRVPLSEYTRMLEQLRQEQRPAPTAYAMGRSQVRVQVREEDEHNVAQVTVKLMLETFEDEWTLVPILPMGVALGQASVNGRPVQLVPGTDGLYWSTNKAGTVTMQLNYGVDAKRSEAGFVLPLPLPRSAATELNLELPATGLDVALVPGVDQRSVEENGHTLISARIPATSAVMISWRAPSKRPYVISRTHYRGALEGDALAWEVVFFVDVFSGENLTLPLMPVGVTLSDISVDGKQTSVLVEDGMFATMLQGRGVHQVRVTFQVPVQRHKGPPRARLLVPRVPVSRFELTLPGNKEIKVAPQTNVAATQEGDTTVATVFLPMSNSVEFTWVDAIPEDLRTRVRANASLYHAVHAEEGVLHGHAMIAYEITHGEISTLELELPKEVQVNRIKAPAGGVSDWAVAPSDDAGRQKIRVFLDGAVKGAFRLDLFYEHLLGGGAKQTEPFTVPLLKAVNVHRQRGMVALLAGSELSLKPVRDARLSRVGENQLPEFVRKQISLTVAHTYKYTDATPELVVGAMAPERKRGNATLYHTVHAEEGVLHGHAMIAYEITRGETNTLELEIPRDVQINRINSPTGGVSDWAVAQASDEKRKKIDVFLERPVKGDLLLEVFYERLLGGTSQAESLHVPLLRAVNVHRQRGMVALLASQELALKPEREERLSRVGENQLPAFVRRQNSMTVAHTYKYTDPEPVLVVGAMAPERKQGKFDASVDTLISLGDVTLKGAAVVEVNVKSGAIMDLELNAPDSVNILSVSGPSLRSHEVQAGETGQTIHMEFTQEMEGQFRVEVNYERIMADSQAQTDVPTIKVGGAEVEHGRIAVEALTAVEVQASETEHLSSLDINELPRQLVLKTTNPILLAYKYVHAEPPFKLVLKITRHQEIDVQVAAIETANYQTLFTRDGLAVTTARFRVRNSRRQFLRLELPAGSEVWSVFVDSAAEKPALAGDAKGTAVLIKMINSATGFPVEIVYATKVEGMDQMGSVTGALPRPDMVVTNSRWDVFLPTGPSYRKPDSNMDIVTHGRQVNPRTMTRDVGAGERPSKVRHGQPLRITVPTKGVHFVFEKLYANRSPEQAKFTIGYVAEEASLVGLGLSLVGAILLWAGILSLGSSRFKMRRSAAIATLLFGLGLLLATIGLLGTNPAPASALTLLTAILVGIGQIVGRWRERRAAKALSAGG